MTHDFDSRFEVRDGYHAFELVHGNVEVVELQLFQ